MEASGYEFEVQGEVIKMIHGELPAVRWICRGCGEDSCTIFYDTEATDLVTECGFCGAGSLVRRPVA
jgi:hypothetical protein